MELGAWVFEHGLQVHVDSYCFSSCANYVFPSGRTRLLTAHASLMWRGGVTQPITPEERGDLLDQMLEDLSEEERRQLLVERPRRELLEELQRSLQAMIARETCFFSKLGVDQRSTTLGHLYERELLEGRGGYYMGWDFRWRTWRGSVSRTSASKAGKHGRRHSGLGARRSIAFASMSCLIFSRDSPRNGAERVMSAAQSTSAGAR